MIKFRKYIPGDEDAIIKLYSQVFNKHLSLDEWNWKYNGLFSNKKIIYLAFKEDLCIAQFALMPYSIYGSRKEYFSYVSLDSMVHPDYQGQRLFTKLKDYALKNMEKIHNPLITFLNEKSLSVYTKKYNWNYLGNIPVYSRVLSLNNIKKNSKLLYLLLKPVSIFKKLFIKSKDNINLRSCKDFDKDILSMHNYDQNFSINRSREFLNWRFNKSPFHYKKYKIFYNRDLIGYCILKIQTKFNLKFLWIMDLIIINKFQSEFSSILNTISKNYYNKADFLVSLLPNKKYRKFYIRSGLFKIPSFLFPHQFYFCVLSENEKINKLDNWYMTWALNDTL